MKRKIFENAHLKLVYRRQLKKFMFTNLGHIKKFIVIPSLRLLVLSSLLLIPIFPGSYYDPKHDQKLAIKYLSSFMSLDLILIFV